MSELAAQHFRDAGADRGELRVASLVPERQHRNRDCTRRRRDRGRSRRRSLPHPQASAGESAATSAGGGSAGPRRGRGDHGCGCGATTIGCAVRRQPLEFFEQRLGRVIARGRIGLQAARDDLVERLRQLRVDRCAATAAPAAMRSIRSDIAVPAPCWRGAERACRAGSARARRRRRAGRPALPSPAPAPCTRRCRRPRPPTVIAKFVAARRGARDAEIHHAGMVFGVEHDVGGLQIAVDDARFVRGHQARDDLLRDAQRARRPAAAHHASGWSRGPPPGCTAS